MEVSVVVATYNGAKKILQLLDALTIQSVKEFELVVVVDGSTDDTAKVVAKYEHGFKNMKLITQDNLGRSVARNRGAFEASGALILFCDDDMELPIDTVLSHVQFHRKHQSSILVANPVIKKDLLVDDEFLKYRRETEIRWSDKLKGRGLHQCDFNTFFFTTQNVSIPRSVFHELNGFDERLMDSEDFDFGVRALLKEVPVFVDGHLRVFHNDTAGLAQTVMRQQQYYYWKSQLLQLHPEYADLLPKNFEWLKDGKTKNIKAFIFKDRKFWERFFSAYLFRSLNSRLRYFLYSTYIYSNSVLKAHLPPPYL